jgi:DNA-binding transcriptional LysR family regulator
MLDGVTLDQMRVLAAIADAGSFSAAAKRLQRAQSAVSHAVATLEGQLGVRLFDRSSKTPVMTVHGHSILNDARSIVARTERLKSKARSLSSGLEGKISIAVSVIVPTSTIISTLTDFASRFPSVGLSLIMEEVGGAAILVRDQVCNLGIVGAQSLAVLKQDEVEQISLGTVDVSAVVAASHPLAKLHRPLLDEDLQDHRQLVPTSRASARYSNTLVNDVWEVADLSTRHAMLRAGLGWGTLPDYVARPDLNSGLLVRLELVARSRESMRVPIYAIHRAATPVGPASRWILERLNKLHFSDEGRSPLF